MMIDLKVMFYFFIREELPFADKGFQINRHIYMCVWVFLRMKNPQSHRFQY